MTEVAAEVKKAAASLKDKFAAYYLRVLEKLAKNEGYVTKELTRLEGILAKGGLAPAKIDELTSKVNILRKFEKEAKDEL